MIQCDQELFPKTFKHFLNDIKHCTERPRIYDIEKKIRSQVANLRQNKKSSKAFKESQT